MSVAASTSSGLTRVWDAGRAVDLAAILGPLRHGSGDPTVRIGTGTGAGIVWRASRTDDGPVTMRLWAPRRRCQVHATAWGPGAASALDRLPVLLGDGDDPAGFQPRHPVIAQSWRLHSAWRVPRTGRVLESLVPAILEQKVTGREAWRAWRQLVRRYGEPAPGPSALLPAGLHVPPEAKAWRTIPSWVWHRSGVDAARSRAVVAVAGSAGRIEALTDLAPAEAGARMRSLPGIGRWTAAEVRQRSFGDPDAVSVGDYHLAGMVGVALVGAPVDDDGMLELLEPYAGHRYRAVRMIELAGLRSERHGPRFAGRDYRDI